MKLISIFVILLCGCSLRPGPFIAPVAVKEIHLINKEACSDSFVRAQEYLLSQGILLRENIAADKILVCLVTPPWILRTISPLYFAGLAVNNTAWAMDNTKVILHELGHLLWGFKHTWTGIMAFGDLGVFGRSFSESELIQMRAQWQP